MRISQNDWRSPFSTVDRVTLPLKSPRPGNTHLPTHLSDAQRRALPILTDFLLANPGSSVSEVAKGVQWELRQTMNYLQRCHFPSVGEWQRRRFYAHGHRPTE